MRRKIEMIIFASVWLPERISSIQIAFDGVTLAHHIYRPGSDHHTHCIRIPQQTLRIESRMHFSRHNARVKSCNPDLTSTWFSSRKSARPFHSRSNLCCPCSGSVFTACCIFMFLAASIHIPHCTLHTAHGILRRWCSSTPSSSCQSTRYTIHKVEME